MGDNLRRYRAIKEGLRQVYGKGAKGNMARHLNTLTGLVSGIVGSQRVNLPDIASKVPDGTQRESRVKRFGRWLDNERIEPEVSAVRAGTAAGLGKPGELGPGHGWE